MRIISRRKFLTGAGAIAVGATLPRGAAGALSPNKPASEQLYKSHRAFHEWYCETFFDFTPHFTALEQEYIEACARHMSEASIAIDATLSYSVASYSHRVQGDHVNSSRAAFGSYRHAAAIQPLAAAVARERGIDPDTVPNMEDLIGLGWDIEAGHFKFYLYLPKLERIQDAKTKELLAKVGELSRYPLGLISYTYAGQKLIERKVYVALTEAQGNPYVKEMPFRDSILHTNLMVTDERGIVPQMDLDGRFSADRLNAAGRSLVERYGSAPVPIGAADTIAYTSADEFTVYFP